MSRPAGNFFFSSLVLAAVACGGAPSTDAADDGAESAADEAALKKSGAPSAFTLQFAGTYDGAPASTIASLVLHANGTYSLARSDGSHERGRYTGGATKTTPLTVTFTRLSPRPHATFVGTIAGYDGKLAVSGDTLTLERPPGVSDEDACTRTGGSWADDEADPVTGLFCACPTKRAFIPSAGGCVSSRHAP